MLKIFKIVIASFMECVLNKVIIITLQKMEQRPSEVDQLAQGHTVSLRWSLGVCAGWSSNTTALSPAF